MVGLSYQILRSQRRSPARIHPWTYIERSLHSSAAVGRRSAAAALQRNTAVDAGLSIEASQRWSTQCAFFFFHFFFFHTHSLFFSGQKRWWILTRVGSVFYHLHSPVYLRAWRDRDVVVFFGGFSPSSVLRLRGGLRSLRTSTEGKMKGRSGASARRVREV